MRKTDKATLPVKKVKEETLGREVQLLFLLEFWSFTADMVSQ